MKKQNRAPHNGCKPITQAQTDPPQYAGSIMGGDRWFKIGLTKVEIDALKKIRQRIYYCLIFRFICVNPATRTGRPRGEFRRPVPAA
jgi:hypothetical protein